MSPSDYFGAARRKVATYMRNGASCAVLLSPFEQRIEVNERGGIVRVLQDPAELVIPVALLPGAREELRLSLENILGA